MHADRLTTRTAGQAWRAEGICGAWPRGARGLSHSVVLFRPPKVFPNGLSELAVGRTGPPQPPGRARTSPCVMKLAISAPLTALSRSQSEKMISGDLPPSSKVTGLMPFADISMILQNKNGALRRLACRCPWPPKAPGPPRPGPWHALPSARRPQTLTRPRRAAEDTRKRDPG